MISEALKCNSSLTVLDLRGDDVHEIDNVIGMNLRWYEQGIA